MHYGVSNETMHAVFLPLYRILGGSGVVVVHVRADPLPLSARPPGCLHLAVFCSAAEFLLDHLHTAASYGACPPVYLVSIGFASFISFWFHFSNCILFCFDTFGISCRRLSETFARCPVSCPGVHAAEDGTLNSVGKVGLEVNLFAYIQLTCSIIVTRRSQERLLQHGRYSTDGEMGKSHATPLDIHLPPTREAPRKPTPRREHGNPQETDRNVLFC